MKNLSSNTRLVIVCSLFVLAFLIRTIWHMGPNIELVTTTMIISSFLMGRKWSILGTLLVLFASDLVLGNTRIFIFTWSGFLIPAIISLPILKRLVKKVGVLTLPISGVAANLFFFAWTNLGVWLLDSWGMYEKNMRGLTMCYINALPFLRNQMMSTIIGLCLIGLAIKLALKLQKVKLFNYNIQTVQK